MNRPKDSRPWRILFFTGDFKAGGTQHYLLRLLSGLDRERFDPTVACFSPTGELHDEAASIAPVVGFPLRGHLFDGHGLATLLRFRRLLRRNRFDLVHALGDRANVFVMLGGLLARQRVVVASQRGLDPRYDSFTYAPPMLVRLSHLLFRHAASLILVNNSAIADHLVRHVGVGGSRVRVIENGIDVSRFAPRPRDPALMRRLEIPEGPPIVGIVARFSGRKGHERLLDALERFSPDERPILVTVGDGRERERFRSEIERRALRPWVRDVGYVADPSPYYGLFDAFCLPTGAEGTPTALLEALACGRPCIVSDLPQLRAVVEHDVSAILVDPSEPEAIAGAIRRIESDQELAAGLGREARALAVRRYSVRAMVEETESLYEELLAQASR